MRRKMFVPLSVLAMALVASVAGAAKPTGTPYQAVDLNPALDPMLGGIGSWAYGVDGGQQGGAYTWGAIPSWKSLRAMLWTGSAASAVDLNPAAFTFSSISGVGGGQQVGQGHMYYYVNKKVGYVDEYHALLWTGSAASAVDLHPAAFASSGADGVGDGQQVGYGAYADGTMHALLWTGTAASVVDLHPAAFTSSGAYRVAAGQQVGWGMLADGTTHALVWTGSAASVVDLNAFLPTGFTDAVAAGIDAAGNVVGYAWGPSTNGYYPAFLWKAK